MSDFILHTRKPGICLECINPYKKRCEELNDHWFIIECFFIEARDDDSICSHEIERRQLFA